MRRSVVMGHISNIAVCTLTERARGHVSELVTNTEPGGLKSASGTKWAGRSPFTMPRKLCSRVAAPCRAWLALCAANEARNRSSFHSNCRTWVGHGRVVSFCELWGGGPQQHNNTT